MLTNWTKIKPVIRCYPFLCTVVLSSMNRFNFLLPELCSMLGSEAKMQIEENDKGQTNRLELPPRRTVAQHARTISTALARTVVRRFVR
jgi:hypothetical protein